MNTLLSILVAIVASVQPECGTIKVYIPVVLNDRSGHTVEFIAYTEATHLTSAADCAKLAPEVRNYCVPATQEEIAKFNKKKTEWITKHSVDVTIDCPNSFAPISK